MCSASLCRVLHSVKHDSADLGCIFAPMHRLSIRKASNTADPLEKPGFHLRFLAALALHSLAMLTRELQHARCGRPELTMARLVEYLPIRSALMPREISSR